MKGTSAVHILRSFFFRSIVHAEVIVGNGNLQTNAHNSKLFGVS